MLNLIFKKGTVTFDCLCKFYAQDFPIRKANHFFPDWWKKMNDYIVEKDENNVEVKVATMKGCLGILNLYRNGFILPLWSDLNIRVDNNGFAYNLCGGDSKLLSHPSYQWNDGLGEVVNIKIETPWKIIEKNQTKVFLTGCHFNTIADYFNFRVSPGIVDYSIIHAVNIFGFLNSRQTPYQYDFYAGTPMIYFLPITEKKIKLNIIPVDDIEFKKKTEHTGRFYGWGLKKEREINKNNTKKCPFFG